MIDSDGKIEFLNILKNSFEKQKKSKLIWNIKHNNSQYSKVFHKKPHINTIYIPMSKRYLICNRKKRTESLCEGGLLKISNLQQQPPSTQSTKIQNFAVSMHHWSNKNDFRRFYWNSKWVVCINHQIKKVCIYAGKSEHWKKKKKKLKSQQQPQQQFKQSTNVW